MTKKSGSKNHHTKEFSRRAKSYSKHNVIQQEVVQKLISSIKSEPKIILDLGCGSGAVYQQISWKMEKFVGIDKAEQMCTLHPRNQNIILYHHDFEDKSFLNTLGHFDMVISSSALQWAKDIEQQFQNIASLADEIALAIFCDGTFKTIYDLTGIQSFLPSAKYLIKLLEKHYTFSYEIKHYKLNFDDNLSKFRYIKQSGVSGGKRRLSLQETKKLIAEYPHEYLEFEILFVWGKVKK